MYTTNEILPFRTDFHTLQSNIWSARTFTSIIVILAEEGRLRLLVYIDDDISSAYYAPAHLDGSKLPTRSSKQNILFWSPFKV